MPLLCVIPARIGSTRLPEKPLRQIAGTPLVSLVVQRISRLGLGGFLAVATDDRRIVREVERLGFAAVMTDPGCGSGTERVAEVLERPEYADVDIVLNVQGDEPFIPAAAVRGALERVTRGDAIGTAAAVLAPERAGDPNRVKVTVDRNGHAVSFSRPPLPAGEGVLSAYLQHLGVYAYTRAALLDWVRSDSTPGELAERLEQLRPMSRGVKIGVAVLDGEAPPGIDTEEDLREAESYLTRQNRKAMA